jgi:nitroreductase
MKALAVRCSAREWDDRNLTLQDLSDLLWAAEGINRPGEKKCTASSAQNARDIDLYLFMRDGVYRYDAEAHALASVLAGDFRPKLMMDPPPRPKDAGGPPPPPPPPPSNPPIQIILVSDTSRFQFGPPELKPEWGAIDAGIVSQNISLFCAATGLMTRPRASMRKEFIKELLKLGDSQYVLLNHPVGYSK